MYYVFIYIYIFLCMFIQKYTHQGFFSFIAKPEFNCFLSPFTVVWLGNILPLPCSQWLGELVEPNHQVNVLVILLMVQKSGIHQLRLVVYALLFTGLDNSQVVQDF